MRSVNINPLSSSAERSKSSKKGIHVIHASEATRRTRRESDFDSDAKVERKIQNARVEWKRRARDGDSSGFISLLRSFPIDWHTAFRMKV